jgi:hypothetical protein
MNKLLTSVAVSFTLLAAGPVIAQGQPESGKRLF